MRKTIDLPRSENVSTQMKEHKETRINRLSHPLPSPPFMNVGLEENMIFQTRQRTVLDIRSHPMDASC